MSYDGECRFLGSLSDILTEAEATRLRNYYATAFRKRLEVHFPDPESFPHDLHDDLIQQAFTEHLAALKQGKLPSKKIIVTRVWTEHWRKERREERSRVASLDDPVTVADGEDAEVQDLVGTSDLARLVPLLLDEDALCIWDAIARVGPNWKAIGAELGCDWRTAKKRVCDVLFPELERAARLLSCGDGTEGVRGLLYAMRAARYPQEFRTHRQRIREVERER